MKRILFLLLMISTITASAQIKPRQIKARAADEILVSEEKAPGKYRYTERNVYDFINESISSDTRIDSIWQNSDTLIFRTVDVSQDTIVSYYSIVLELNELRLRNEVWSIHGDSFSAHIAPTRYPQYVLEKNNITSYAKHAQSGFTMRQVADSLNNLLIRDPAALDTITLLSVMAGVNDYARDTIVLGSVGDRAGVATYAGQLKRFIVQALGANPRMRMFVMTPPEAFSTSVPYKIENDLGWTMEELSSLISEIGNYYAIPVINLYTQSRYNHLTKEVMTTPDRLHPSELGAERLAEIISVHFREGISTAQVSSSIATSTPWQIVSSSEINYPNRAVTNDFKINRFFYDSNNSAGLENQLFSRNATATKWRNFFGARSTGGTLDWNHITNTRAGSGYSLLRGLNAENAPNPDGVEFFHPFNIEYINQGGSGNITQFAIPYADENSLNYGISYRGRLSGNWSDYIRLWSSANDGLGSDLDAGKLAGELPSFYLDNTDNQNDSEIQILSNYTGRLSGLTTQQEVNNVIDTMQVHAGTSSKWENISGGGIRRQSVVAVGQTVTSDANFQADDAGGTKQYAGKMHGDFIVTENSILGNTIDYEAGSRGRFTGGFGATRSTGVLDFNDPSNSVAGSGQTLLRGLSANNSPNNGLGFWHTFNFLFGNRLTGDNRTQFAIPYANDSSIEQGLYIRGKFNTNWTEWHQIPAVDVISLLDGDRLAYNLSQNRFERKSKFIGINGVTVFDSNIKLGGIISEETFFDLSNKNIFFEGSGDDAGNRLQINGTGLTGTYQIDPSGTTFFDVRASGLTLFNTNGPAEIRTNIDQIILGGEVRVTESTTEIGAITKAISGASTISLTLQESKDVSTIYLDPTASPVVLGIEITDGNSQANYNGNNKRVVNLSATESITFVEDQATAPVGSKFAAGNTFVLGPGEMCHVFSNGTVWFSDDED
jgi:lysophospholipase L1-like esterase